MLLLSFLLGFLALAHLSLPKLRMPIGNVLPQVSCPTAFGAYSAIGRDKPDSGLSFDLQTGCNIFEAIHCLHVSSYLVSQFPRSCSFLSGHSPTAWRILWSPVSRSTACSTEPQCPMHHC